MWSGAWRTAAETGKWHGVPRTGSVDTRDTGDWLHRAEGKGASSTSDGAIMPKGKGTSPVGDGARLATTADRGDGSWTTGSKPTHVEPKDVQQAGRMPWQVRRGAATPAGHDPTTHEKMSEATCIERVAQALCNLFAASSFYHKVQAADKAPNSSRKWLSHWGAIPARAGQHAYGKWRDPGNWYYQVVLETIMRAHFVLFSVPGRDTHKGLEQYNKVTNTAKQQERAGDILESVLGRCMLNSGVQVEAAGWHNNPWNIQMSEAEPEQRDVVYFILFFQAIEDMISVFEMPNDAVETAKIIMSNVSVRLSEIFQWYGSDPSQRARSNMGWMRQKQRDADRAKMRREASRSKGKGGKSAGNIKGGAVSGTPPAGGGAGKGHGKGTHNGKGIQPPGASSSAAAASSGGASSGGGKGVGGASSSSRGYEQYAVLSDSDHSTANFNWGELDDPAFHPKLTSEPSMDWANRGTGKGSSTPPQRWVDAEDSEPDWD
jgi:hypothetical protein